MQNVLGIRLVEKTLAKRQVINRIKQVCFANAVITHKAIYLIGKLKFSITVILEIAQKKILQVHFLESNYIRKYQFAEKGVKLSSSQF
jgi:hypothetical protein